MTSDLSGTGSSRVTRDSSATGSGEPTASARPARERRGPLPRPYEAPRLARVAVRTTRDHLNWQYAGEIVCTNHNHSDPGGGTNGCSFPQ